MLELTMRESLEGMAELATEFAYRSTPGVFEIIAIEAVDEASSLAADGFKTG
jgi:hypothetical protein